MVTRTTMRMEGKTLGDLVKESYADFQIRYGSAPMGTDLRHGVEIKTIEDKNYGHDVIVEIYPFFKWTDGLYKPVHYGWGSEYYLSLHKERRRA